MTAPASSQASPAAVRNTSQSYHVRLRRDAADRPWHATLHCTATGQEVGFDDLDRLVTVLRSISLEQMPGDRLFQAVQDAAASSKSAARLGPDH